jgi:aldehyde:ferredoxin oxidoreductase
MTIAGTILKIDLTDGKIEKKPTAPYMKDWIGGVGIATRIMWEEVPPDTRAFSPENAIIFSTGAITGTLLGTKGEVCTKAPEQANHPYTHSGIGGHFPSEMKYAGYDQIVIKGKTKELSYLYVNNDSVEIRDARHLKGLDVHETQWRIKQELGDPDIQVACIGMSGEKMAVYANIVHDIDNSASKRGLGAVMGSKNLKAVAVRGTKGIKIADPKKFLELYDEFYDGFREGGRAYAFGKTFHLEGMSRYHVEGYDSIRRDFRKGKKYLGSEVPPSPTMDFIRKYSIANTGCAFCPLQCHQNISVPGIGNGGAMCVCWWGLVYANLYERTDFNLWWKRTMLCERYGIDHLYVEMVGAWLIDLYKRGIITEKETDGIPMIKGSEEAITALIEKMDKVEGFGEMFWGGIVPAAQKIGKGSIDYANQRGNATPYLAPGLGVSISHYLGPAVKYRTGDIEDGGPLEADGLALSNSFAECLGISPQEAGKFVEINCDQMSEKITGDKNVWRADGYHEKDNVINAYREDSNCLCDVSGHCTVISERYCHSGMLFGCEEYTRWINAGLGTNYTTEQTREVALKIRLLIDSYRVLSALMLGEKHVESKYATMNGEIDLVHGGGPEVDKIRGEEFCRMRGYDPVTGIPTREMLEKLGLKDVADKLEEVIDRRSPKLKEKQQERVSK